MAQYTVKKGETLSGIAQKQLGSASRWKELGYKGDPTKLQIGTILNIPEKAGPTKISDIATYAGLKGYSKYFQKAGQWYGNIAGVWKTFGSKEQARQANITATQKAEKIQVGITATAKKTKALTERVAKEGITPTPTTPLTPPPAGLGTTLPPAVDPNEQARDDAAEEVNANAQTIFDNIPTGDDVDMRDSTKILEDIQTKLQETEEKIPAPASMVDLFKAKKKELGIDILETELAGIDSEIEAIQTTLLVEAEKAGQEIISAREIGRKRGSLQRTAEQRIALLNVERSAIARQLSNKYDSLEMVMEFQKKDFTNATNYYTQQYNRTLQIYDLFIEAQEREETREEKATKTALTNWDVITASMKDAGISFTDLTDDQALKLRKIEVEAGLPEGFSEKTLVSIDPEKEIISKIVSSDKSMISILYSDGQVETFQTGITPEAEAKTDFTSSQKQKLEQAGIDPVTQRQEALDFLYGDEEELTDTEKMAETLTVARGADGYVSPEDYKEGKDYWFKELGLDKEDYDKEFSKFANPSHIRDYEIEKETREAEMFLTDDQMKSVGIALVKSMGKEDALKAVEQGTININKKQTDLSPEQITKIKEIIEEEYPKGRTRWQKALPWGK